MNEERNVIVFLLQLVVFICSILYVLYIAFSKEYFETTPPTLGIISLAVALLYFCAIGYSKFSIKNLDSHHLKVNDKFVYIFKIGYVILGIIVLLGTSISLFFVDNLTIRWSDALGILTLMFTLSVELMTYGIFLIAKRRMVNYGRNKD